MQVSFIETPTCESIAHAVAQNGRADAVALIVVGEKSGLEPEALRAHLLDTNNRFVGVICPGIIFAARLYPGAALVIHFPSVEDPVTVIDLEQRSSDLPFAVLHWSEARSDAFARQTLLVLVDGLAQGTSRLLSDVSELVGFDLTYVGAGGAYSDLISRPCLFTHEGAFSNAAVLLPLHCRTSCGVQHGWRRKGEPLIVTRSVSHWVVELNWRSAFDVYRDALRETFGKEVTRENFSNVARQHPLGILRVGDEELVRDPIRVEKNGSLFCVGSVPENATVSLMEGVPEQLLEAAKQATKKAVERSLPETSLLMVMDCVSRCLFLGERFVEELRIIATAAAEQGFKGKLAGFLSFGEIAQSRRGWAEFHNKTIVAAAFYE